MPGIAHRPSVPEPLEHTARRLERALRRHGPAGAIRVLIEKIHHGLRLQETHVWYQSELDENRPRMPIPDGFRLVRANSEHLPVVDDFGPVGRLDAERRHRDGASLWLLLDEQERPVFSCWTFVDHFPVFVAEGGTLPLREGTAALEDSYTAAEHRGQQLGPAAFCAVVDRLVEDGVSHLITKVTEDNGSARKAALKSGFHEIGIMRTSRLLWFKPRVEVSVIGGGEGPFLDRQLSNGDRRLGNADRRQLSTAA